MKLLILTALCLQVSQQTTARQPTVRFNLAPKQQEVGTVHSPTISEDASLEGNPWLSDLVASMSKEVRPYLLASLISNRDEKFWKPDLELSSVAQRVKVTKTTRNGETYHLVRLANKPANLEYLVESFVDSGYIDPEHVDGWLQMRRALEVHGRGMWVWRLWESVLRGK